MAWRSAILWFLILAAQVRGQAPIEIRIGDETVPPGGLVQIKCSLTDPQPISSGGGTMAFERTWFDSVEGIAVYSIAGDSAGVASPQGGRLAVRFVSPAASLGTQPDYPFLTVVLRTNASAPPGTRTPITLDLSSAWHDALGRPYPVSVKPGTITFGGSLSVANVVPGGGLVPAGNVVRILGTGFTPNTRVQINEVNLTATRILSSTEIEVQLQGGTEMSGRRIEVRNPDGQRVTYFSYLRAAPVGASAVPLLGAAVPLFPARPLTDAAMPLTVADHASGRFEALAFQNQNLVPARIEIELIYASASPSRLTSLTLPPGSRISRALGEWFPGAPLPAGAVVRISAPLATQMMGILGDTRAGTLDPITLRQAAAVNPAVGGVRNAASQQQGPLSPGSLVSVYGSFPGVVESGLRLTPDGRVSTLLSGARVLVNGVPAPLTYASASQINAVVPYEVEGAASLSLVAEIQGTRSPAAALAGAAVSPAIFTLDSSGVGQAAVLNQDGSTNRQQSPAPLGSVISIFASGEGQYDPPLLTGSVSGTDPRRLRASIGVLISGQAANILYAGPAPGLVAGVLQVNAEIPATAPVGGAAPLTLLVNGVSSQPGVTVAVR